MSSFTIKDILEYILEVDKQLNQLQATKQGKIPWRLGQCLLTSLDMAFL